MKTIRIFISSPGDVAEERDKAKHVIATLQRHYGAEVHLIPVLWEELPLEPVMSFQQGIDLVLTGPQRIDIAIFILWSRMGTPNGPPPRADGTPYRSGTEREFDLMIEARKQSNSKSPHILVYTRRDDEAWNTTLDAKKPDGVLKELVEQRETVRGFIKESFQDKDGHNIRAYHSYDEPVTFAERLETHLKRLLDDMLLAGRTTATWIESPYRSLEVFDICHAPIFNGRDEESYELRKRLRSQANSGCAFVCIVGASGSGKSSLARAGVAATLVERSFDKEVKEWRTAVFLPSLNSGDLIGALSQSLGTVLTEFRKGPGGTERLAARLKDNHQAAVDLLDAAFKSASETLNGAVRLILIVDQMEELWTDGSITPEIRERFLAVIELLARSGHVSVLATLRSDFYPKAQDNDTFMRMKGTEGHFDLRTPGAAALRELIVRPALISGIAFERDEQTGRTLDQRILEDATSEGVVLPLLQYALAELYDHRDSKQRLLTFASYEAMKGEARNGVEGALGKRASETFSLLPSEAQTALNDLLPLLVSVDVEGERQGVRRRAPLSELTKTPSRQLLTESLRAARFLTTDQKDGVAVASLAHEALLRCWDRVVAWINANRDLLRMRSQLEQSQHRWEQSSDEDSLLLHDGLALSEGRRLLTQAVHLLEPATQAYVSKSIAHYLAGVIASGHDATERSQEIEDQHPIEWRGVVAGAFVSSSANVRKNVADLVANRPSAEFQDELIALVTCDEVEAVRAAAAQALVSRGRLDAYDKIRDSLLGVGNSTLRGSSNALALLKATSDMQKTKRPFVGWFDALPSNIQWPARLVSYVVRFKAAVPTFIFVVIPAMIFAVVGAGSVKWLPSWLDYSCVQGAGSLGMGFFHAAPSGIMLGGGVVFGLTLYRMVFGREYDEASLLKPLPAIVFGAVSGLVMGILCVVMIASIYNQQGLYVMGWIGERTKPDMMNLLHDLFFENRCGLAFPLTSTGFGIASALMTNNLRGSRAWKDFLDEQSALSTMNQLIGVIKGLAKLTIPYAWPIPTFVTLFAAIALVVVNSANEAPKWAFPLVSETFTGGLDNPKPGQIAELKKIKESKNGLMPSKKQDDAAKFEELENKEAAIRKALDGKIRDWKRSFAGLALGLFGDCLAKIVGGYFCIVGMGVGIVMLRHGIKIEARKV
ncbi:MAG: AAA family ATPase [Prosthecobacter sp.]|uniref:nSTAND1 domain-containing NTPase n=1 Tax=Prosthecobacter sp. TaxID=1965333 RepID=UPI0039024B84